MTKQTKRDTVWGTALRLAVQLEEFDIAEVLAESNLGQSSKRTTRDVLKSMVEQGWLETHTCENTGRLLYSEGSKLSETTDSG